jgi:hypothetical protein
LTIGLTCSYRFSNSESEKLGIDTSNIIITSLKLLGEKESQRIKLWISKKIATPIFYHTLHKITIVAF